MSGRRKSRILQNAKTIKVTVVGDSHVGKTCLLLTYVTKQYPGCAPASFEWHLAGTGYNQNTFPSVKVNGEQHFLDFADILGFADQHQSLRRLEYMTTDVFVVCFDISSQESFANAKDIWMPEIRATQPEIPAILVGTKLDLRHNSEIRVGLAGMGKRPVSHDEGQRLARELKVVDYVECSSMQNEGIRSVFLTAAHAACMAKKAMNKANREENVTKTNGCCVLL